MESRGVLRSATVLAILAFGSGCSLYQPRPVTFSVRDGDTGQPIQGAEVRANYLVMLDFGVLFGSVGPMNGVTDRDGNLTMVVDPTHRAFRLTVNAMGYSGYGWDFESPHWWKRVPQAWYSLRDEYEVQLFRGPQPTAEVMFPNDYRGVVVVKFAAKSSPPAVPGQRTFSYTASLRGAVEIKETALFQSRYFYEGIRARYEDGFVLPTVERDWSGRGSSNQVADDAVALRHVWSTRNAWLYVLGTAAEAKVVERSVWPDDNHFNDAAFDAIVAAH
jgi:hypothetical protein